MIADYLITGFVCYVPAIVIGVVLMRSISRRWLAIVLSLSLLMTVTILIVAVSIGLTSTYGTAGGMVEILRAWPVPIAAVMLLLIKSPGGARVN